MNEGTEIASMTVAMLGATLLVKVALAHRYEDTSVILLFMLYLCQARLELPKAGTIRSKGGVEFVNRSETKGKIWNDRSSRVFRNSASSVADVAAWIVLSLPLQLSCLDYLICSLEQV